MPKGVYRVSRTLRLGPKTKLVGIGHAFSIVTSRPEDSVFFSDANHPKAIVETADEAEAHQLHPVGGLAHPVEQADMRPQLPEPVEAEHAAATLEINACPVHINL